MLSVRLLYLYRLCQPSTSYLLVSSTYLVLDHFIHAASVYVAQDSC